MDLVTLFLIAAFASGHDTCEPDMYGNLWCDPTVEDRLTLERFLFEPPIINEKPTLPMGLDYIPRVMCGRTNLNHFWMI